jgi:hypothetical protein
VSGVPSLLSNRFIVSRYESTPAFLRKIREKKALDDEIKGQLGAVLKEAKEKFKAEKGRAA